MIFMVSIGWATDEREKTYETTNIRILIRILYQIAAVIAMLTGLGIAISGCTEAVEIEKQQNTAKMIIGFSITILSPFLLQVLYRLTIEFHTDGCLLFDDTVVEKRYAKAIQPIRRQWSGSEKRVASGIYFYQLQTDNISPLRKMLILK